MARRIRHSGSARNPGENDDWDLAEGLDPEGPSADDLDRFGDELTSCPHCEAAIYDQASFCPVCGEALTEGEKTLSLWVVLGVCALIVLLLLFAF